MTPDNMKKSRDKLKLSQKEIAEELEISPRFWHYRERGERSIPRWLARAIRDLVRSPSSRP